MGFKSLLVFLFIAHQLSNATQNPSYLLKQKEVEKKHTHYVKLFKNFYSLLEKQMPIEAQEAWNKIKNSKPKELDYGYQVLGDITPKVFEKINLNQVQSTKYSWERTESILQAEKEKIEDFKLKLNSKVSTQTERIKIFEEIAKEYPTLKSNQQMIEEHLNYNRFWQKTIASSLPYYRHLTFLHDAVLERQRIRSLSLNEKQERSLFQRERFLDREIKKETEKIYAPKFIKINRKENNVILEVPIYTDIEDKEYLKKFKTIIEREWKVEGRNKKEEVVFYSVELIYHHFPPAHKKGDHIDVDQHVTRFPKNGAILTTGASNTYALPGHYIVLGPSPTSENTLAHEFGHILGFTDTYFRGFHDLNPNGYEILETVSDPEDIMCAPRSGKVTVFHFERVLKSLAPEML